MFRTSAIIILLLAGVISSAISCSGKKNTHLDATHKKDNVILVSIDTVRADRLGCYGYSKRNTSPNLDRLADEGILFENFITAAPWTTPAHLSMITSLNPSTHGMTQAFGDMWSKLFKGRDFFKLPSSRITLAEVLKNNGFKTAAFTAGGPLDPALGFEQGFDRYETSMYKLRKKNMKEMFSWLGENKSRQFFLFWHNFEVHSPYLSTDFVNDVLPENESGALVAEMNKIADVPLKKVWPSGASIQRKKQTSYLKTNKLFTRDVCDALYTSGIKSADRWFGRLVSHLKKLGIYDNTMIIVTSDHGEEMGDHNLGIYYNVHGHTLYDEMVKVPLIIKLPRQRAAGTRVSKIARTIDIMPTVLDSFALKPTKNEMQGSSLAPYWLAADKTPDRIAYTESLARRTEKKSLRTSRYKYILNIDAQTVKEHGRGYLPTDKSLNPELFDLKKDPAEKINLIGNDTSAKIKDLSARFSRLLRTHINTNQGKAEPAKLNDDTVEKLKGLGYLGN